MHELKGDNEEIIMSTQFTIEPAKQTTNTPRPRYAGAARFRFWMVLPLAGVAAVALAVLPALLPGLASSVSGTAPQAYWFISRASAFVAFGLLWLSMLAGLGITSKLGRYWPGMPTTYELHRITALLGLGF